MCRFRTRAVSFRRESVGAAGSVEQTQLPHSEGVAVACSDPGREPPRARGVRVVDGPELSCHDCLPIGSVARVEHCQVTSDEAGAARCGWRARSGGLGVGPSMAMPERSASRRLPRSPRTVDVRVPSHRNREWPLDEGELKSSRPDRTDRQVCACGRSVDHNKGPRCRSQ
jgi:hypothetical protein